MRCDECKVEPVTPNHFCECCGRKLSLQERKALDEKKAAQTSWGEPAPVLPKAPKGDRLVGIHFTPEPEPYVDEPAPVVDPVDVDTHVRDFDAAWPEPTVPVAAPATIDPILEAHFAGHAPVAAAPDSQVSAPPAVAPVVEPHVSADVPAARLDSDVPAARCESCGGPAEVGDLCSRCQQAFHSLLDAPPASEPIAVAAPPAPPRRTAGGRAGGERCSRRARGRAGGEPGSRRARTNSHRRARSGSPGRSGGPRRRGCTSAPGAAATGGGRTFVAQVEARARGRCGGGVIAGTTKSRADDRCRDRRARRGGGDRLPAQQAVVRWPGDGGVHSSGSAQATRSAGGRFAR